jgi:hypothetical protein
MVKQAGRKGRPPARKQPGKMDIRTVAQLANVSIATVSRTINRVSTVNPKMAKRVWEAIEKLDYFPNTQARALVSGRSRLLGLIVSEITNPFFPELIQGFEDIAVEHGYEILISSTNYDPRRMSLCIRRMLERRAEGVAVMTFGVEQPLLEQLAAKCRWFLWMSVRRGPASACCAWTIATGSSRGCNTWQRWDIERLHLLVGPSGCTRRNPAWLHLPARLRNAASRPIRRGWWKGTTPWKGASRRWIACLNPGIYPPR